jgi:hypothetical protein
MKTSIDNGMAVKVQRHGLLDNLTSHQWTFSYGAALKIKFRSLCMNQHKLKDMIQQVVGSTVMNTLCKTWDQFTYCLNVVMATHRSHTQHLQADKKNNPDLLL